MSDASLETVDEPQVRRAESLGRRALLALPRFARRHGPLRTLLLLTMLVTVAAAIFPSVFATADPTEIGFEVFTPPSSDHWLGTDQLGRDVFSRVVYGARPAVIVAVLSVVFGVSVGVPMGLIAGYTGRWIGGVIMRLVDVMLAMPGLLMALVVVTLLGSGLRTIVIAIAIAFIPWFANGLRRDGEHQETRIVDSAVVLGASPFRILTVHIAPNLGSQVAVLATAALGWAILISATLNFLGFGLSPPASDWGIDLQFGRQALQQAWWMAVAPGVAITLTILASNLLGDVVADQTAGVGRSQAA